jgi:hypothetical protein
MLLCQESDLQRLPWGEDTVSNPSQFHFNPLLADSILCHLDPLTFYRHLITISSNSYLTSVQASRLHQQALVAAADLRATYRVSGMSRFPIGASNPYILHTVDVPSIPVVVDTGASNSITPNASDFIGPIKTPDLKSLQGLVDPSTVDGKRDHRVAN